jgi:hypothetical protein
MAPAPPALTALVAKEKARQAFWPYCAVRRSSGHWGRIPATGTTTTHDPAGDDPGRSS